MKKVERVYWHGSCVCDICGKEDLTELVDGRIKTGQWATMCLKCFAGYGVGLGLGRGQQYRMNQEEKMEKVK